MKLHEAIKEALLNLPGKIATPHEITIYIKLHDLYKKKNGENPNQAQISARINKYLNLFKKHFDGRIGLVEDNKD